MLKKRNNAWTQKKKEKQNLTARLIEISMKIEDYVYKHKLISRYEAEQYMREVSSYKALCSRDERSLQVIEKVTRCMKAIILDHQEEVTPDICSTNINSGSILLDGAAGAGSISPVYSLPDEDRLLLTQTIEEGVKNVVEENNDIEIIDLSNIDDDDDLIYSKIDTRTAIPAGLTVNIDVDIHRSMSGLSLKDVETPLEMTSTDASSSQSVLKNFKGVEGMQQKKININPHEVTAAALVINTVNKGKATNRFQTDEKNDKIYFTKAYNTVPNITEKMKPDINKPNIRCESNSNFINKAVGLNIPPITVMNISKNSVTKTVNEKEPIAIPSQTFYPAINKDFETQRQTFDQNGTCTLNTNHILKDTNHTAKPAQIRQGVILNIVKNIPNVKVDNPTFNKAANVNNTKNNEIRKPNNATTTTQNNTTTTKKKRAPRKKVTDENKIKLTNKNKRVNKTMKRGAKKNFTNTKNNGIPIYNSNVVDDLSWIENIRYVREIKEDENDPKLNLEDSFWDNYYLPANWDENDFL